EDLALRQRVEALLRANLQASDILDQPTAVAWDERPPAERTEGPPTREDIAPAGSPGHDPDRTPDLHAKRTVTKACPALRGPPTKPGALGGLGHYEVLEVVGQGGFGIVLKAFDEKLHRVVAVKVLAPALAATSSARQRFVREARAAAALRHDHVVR